MFKGVCPRCRVGQIFSGWLTMNPRCPHCGLVFDREPGYFLGAMMISYGFSVVLCSLLFFGLGFIWDLTMGLRLSLTAVLYLPIVPLVFRYSRIVWIYWDNTMDPQK